MPGKKLAKGGLELTPRKAWAKYDFAPNISYRFTNQRVMAMLTIPFCNDRRSVLRVE